MADSRKDRELFWDDGTIRSQNNAFTSSRYRVDMSRESSALVAGANSAATKRARGQDLMPKLHLKGSNHRSLRKRREHEPQEVE
jgi:hypothetical protein